MTIRKQGYQRSSHMDEIRQEMGVEPLDEVAKLKAQIKQLEADKAQISETAAVYRHEIEQLKDKIMDLEEARDKI